MTRETKTKIKKIAKKIPFAKKTWHLFLRFKNAYLKRKLKPKKMVRTRPSVIQLLPCYVAHDAIGIATFEFSRFLLSRHIENYVVYLAVAESACQHNGYLYDDFSFNEKDTVILHLAVGSDLSYFFKSLKVEHKIIIYHNITPSKFMADPFVKSVCDKGRDELKMLYDVPDFSICDSSFNKSELDYAGYKNTFAVPLPTQTYKLLNNIKTKTKKDYYSFITVGRIVPNKCIHDVIKVFMHIHKLNKHTRLAIIGKITDEKYYKKIANLISKYNLSKSIRFVYDADDNILSEYYSNADGYICMSEHEGFCVPLVESMAFGLPIFAYNSTAIGETVGDAGILFKTKNYVSIAHTILNTLSDKKKVETLVSNSINRYKNVFNNEKNMKTYLDLMSSNQCITKSNESLKFYYQIFENFIQKVDGSKFPLKLMDYLNDYEKNFN